MFTKIKNPTLSSSPPKQIGTDTVSPKPASRVVASIISTDVEIKGSIKSSGAIHIDGKVEGDITADDVTIGSAGQIVGEIKAETLLIKGKTIGSIHAGRVELESGAVVEGDIIHTTLVIQPDASIEGQIKREEKAEKKSTPNSFGIDSE